MGSQFQVNTYTTFSQNAAVVSAAPDGSFVVVWQSDNDQNIRAQRFDSAGSMIGSEIQANTGASFGRPSIAHGVDGSSLKKTIVFRMEPPPRTRGL